MLPCRKVFQMIKCHMGFSFGREYNPIHALNMVALRPTHPPPCPPTPPHVSAFKINFNNTNPVLQKERIEMPYLFIFRNILFRNVHFQRGSSVTKIYINIVPYAHNMLMFYFILTAMISFKGSCGI